jgi:hypothetical protein
LTRNGLETLDWILNLQTSTTCHFRPVGSDSFGREFSRPRPFDQQPVEAWAAIDGARAAFDATHYALWLDHADRAFGWFTGGNDRAAPVGDLFTGTCHDGINPRGLNLNEGAESVLAFQLAQCSYNDLMAKANANLG